MKRSAFRTIRWKFIYIFLGSIALSAAVVLMFYGLFYILIFLPLSSGGSLGERPESKTLFWIVNNVGSTPIMVLIGCGLFLLFFFQLSSRPIRYLEEITEGIQQVAGGDFTHRIPKRTTDELGIVADTVNRMTERLRASIEEERAAEQAKNDLITGVSHDLRTPLTSILGFLEYIEEDRYKDETELKYFVSIAYDKSITLKKLIDDLFEYTRTSGRSVPMRFAPLNATDFMRQLAEEFEPLFRQRGMTCRLSTDDPRLMIDADGNELVRAFENLLSNAVRYGKPDSEVRVEIAVERQEVVIRIANAGEPIPARDLPFVFDRFYRADPSRSRVTGGTGLGLAIAKNIIELHDGRIGARSDPKETVFETRLPRWNDEKQKKSR